MNMKSYRKVNVLKMRNNKFAEQFLADIAKRQEYWERYGQMSDEEKRQLKLEQEQEAQILDDIVAQTTGVRPSWF